MSNKMNTLAAEYSLLKTQLAAIEGRIKEIGDIFKAAGSQDTGDFLVTISDVEREQLANLARVSEIFGRQVLEKNDLINKITYQTVKVAIKGRKAA